MERVSRASMERCSVTWNASPVQVRNIEERTAMKARMKVRSDVKAGGIALNHNQSLVKVRSGIKAGGTSFNHNWSLVKVRSGVKGRPPHARPLRGLVDAQL